MNKKFVYQVGNNKKSYTMMHGQPNIYIKKMLQVKYITTQIINMLYVKCHCKIFNFSF